MEIRLVTKKFKVTLCIALSMFYAVSAKAQNEDQSQQDSVVLTLGQAIEISLCDNPSIKIGEREIELKKYSKWETISGLLPNISATGALQNSLQLQKMKLDFSPEPIAMGQKYVANGTFNLSLPLVAPQLWKTIQLNQKDLELSVEKSRESKIEQVNQVRNAYYSLLLAKDAYEALASSYKTAQLNAEFVTKNYEQGKASEYDKLVADVQYRNIKPLMVNGESAIKLAILSLKVLMGVDVDSPIIFAGSLKNYEEEMLSDYMYLKNDTSLVNNSILKQLEIQGQMLKDTKLINKFGYIPTLGMGLSYGWQAMHKDLKIKNYDWFPGSTLSFSLSVPIFDGGKKYFKTKQDNISIGNLELLKQNTIRQLQLSVTNSLDNISAAVEQVTSNKESVQQAEKAYYISQKRYAVGSGTLLEMNTSETALTQARLQYAQSIYDYLSAKSNLDSTLGKSIDEYLCDKENETK